MFKRLMTLIFFVFFLFAQNGQVLAQTIKVPAGTPISVYVEKEIDADDVDLEQSIDFIVHEPVYVNNKLVFNAGTPILGKVIKLKNNSIFGISGEIQIGKFKLNIANQAIYLRGTILNKGTNRSWVNVGWLFLFTLPFIFVKGNDGKIPADSYYVLYTIGDNFVELN